MVALVVSSFEPLEAEIIGLSPEATAGLYVVLMGGLMALITMIVSPSLERYLRKRGKVHFVAWDGDLGSLWVGSVDKALFSFEAYLFNARPLPTRLRGPSVTFLHNGAKVATAPLRDSISGKELGSLNLPPWWEGRVSLYAVLEGEQARELVGSVQVEFVCRLSGGGMFGRKIGGRKDFVGGRKKLGTMRKDFAARRKRCGATRMDFIAGRRRLRAHR